jgi:hypothetical protein
MSYEEHPINIYLPSSLTENTWRNEPRAKDDLIYVRRDALTANVEYKSVVSQRRDFEEGPMLNSVSVSCGELTSILRLQFSDKDYTHMMRKYAHISDVANQLRYFASELLR